MSEERENIQEYIENTVDEFLDEARDAAIDALEGWIEDQLVDLEAFWTTDRSGVPCLVWDIEDAWDIDDIPAVSVLLDNWDQHEMIHECADSNCPVYTATILELACSEWELAMTVPEIGPAFDGDATPVNIIAANIYERLESECWDRWNNIDDWLVIELDGDIDTFGTGCNIINSLFNFYDFKLDN